MRENIKAAQNSGAQGIILDLRNNTGGNIYEAVCIAGLFLGKNKLIAEERPTQAKQSEKPLLVFTSLSDDGKFEYKRGLGNWFEHYSDVDKVVKVPTVVLINSGSASASELVAGALQDYGTAIIAGERSFGKASVQKGNRAGSFIDFTTVARFYSPGNSKVPTHTAQIVGITPDVKIVKNPNIPELEQSDIREEDYSPIRLDQKDAFTEVMYPEMTKKLNDCLIKMPAAASDKGSDYQLSMTINLMQCVIKQ